MPVAGKVSLIGRVFDGARRIFRNPFVRASALTLGLGVLSGGCGDKGRVMEAPNDGKGGWDLAAETYARNNLKLGESPRIAEISAALKGCFALKNDISIAPEDIVVGEAGKNKIHPPDEDCVSAVMALATGQARPAAAVTTTDVAPAEPIACGPFSLPPLEKITVTIETLLRNKANDITIPVPEGVTFTPESLAGIFVPQGQLGMELSGLTLSADGRTITGKATPTKEYSYSQHPTSTFQLPGRHEHKIGEIEQGILITEELTPVVFDIEVTSVEAAPVRRGGGHHGGGGQPVEAPPQDQGGVFIPLP